MNEKAKKYVDLFRKVCGRQTYVTFRVNRNLVETCNSET